MNEIQSLKDALKIAKDELDISRQKTLVMENSGSSPTMSSSTVSPKQFGASMPPPPEVSMITSQSVSSIIPLSSSSTDSPTCISKPPNTLETLSSPLKEISSDSEENTESRFDFDDISDIIQRCREVWSRDETRAEDSLEKDDDNLEGVQKWALSQKKNTKD